MLHEIADHVHSFHRVLKAMILYDGSLVAHHPHHHCVVDLGRDLKYHAPDRHGHHHYARSPGPRVQGCEMDQA